MTLSGLTYELSALAQVLMIDIALAGDNAVVVGMAVSGLPARQRRPAILAGRTGSTDPTSGGKAASRSRPRSTSRA